MKPPRRLVFQLTSLLDLLLIVMFAQYIEMRVQEQELKAAVLLRDQDYQQQLWLKSQQVSHSQETIQRLAKIMAEVVKLAPDQVAGNLSAEVQALLSKPILPADALEQKRLTDAMVEHFLVHDQMRKRIDLWQLHLDESGVLTISTGQADQVKKFRVTTAEQIAGDLFGFYKTVDQPKSLVVMLLSWGNARFGDRQAMEQGLEMAAHRIQQDTGVRTRVEFANIGYRPDQPSH